MTKKSKLLFYINIFVITFLSVNIFKHYTADAPLEDYLIYILIALNLFAIIVKDLVELFYNGSTRKVLLISDCLMMFSYLFVGILSMVGIMISTSTFGRILYIAFLIISILFITITLYKLTLSDKRKHREK
ncbi:hypothetical protein [Macrococcus epidermidis]|uniref:hypothetical protein n=1 Tax=Macrococcus epidermidis TaxID=1902580 RepID=UPI0020B8D660|nr:hypothetical protein [Macrococcus epidermidis]UTH16710.1 hypothetical protein KFV12_02765 [Macrococcus epidermidis]